ncbi:uncharacterized protein SPSK_07910 [Sporothrix schenckii 1099-18]|uniref:Uncharacterized protein n=1 Tax=Sporothrix schenckii 1099-18 TaxID=1397361 RepID=A0A0F2MEL3_SPOSC|nr:uncharacterized protein SPSK_07910 [Sporothrix schenckii 1099-18]KJR88123.1 hypothetical protein SPSK_07910 [Sporothrix schenckii 1099-18]
MSCTVWAAERPACGCGSGQRCLLSDVVSGGTASIWSSCLVEAYLRRRLVGRRHKDGLAVVAKVGQVLVEGDLVLGRERDPVLAERRARHLEAPEMPNLPRAVLLKKVQRVLAPHPVRPHALAVHVLVLRLVQILGHRADVARVRQARLDARHEPEALGRLAVLGHLDEGRRRLVQNQLAFGRGPPRVVLHDAVVVCVHADVGVLRVDARRAAGDPKRLDLLVLEDVVQVHVLAKDVFHGAAVVGLGVLGCILQIVS